MPVSCLDDKESRLSMDRSRGSIVVTVSVLKTAIPSTAIMSRVIDPATLDILDRLSASNRDRHEQDHHDREYSLEARRHCTIGFPSSTSYHEMEGRDIEIATDQVREATLLDLRWLGLAAHNVATGFVSTVLPFSVYPFLTAYLNMEGTQTLSARALLSVPWALRPLYGAFVNCASLVPTAPFRAYVSVGWAICAAALFVASFTSIPAPYFRDRSLVGVAQSELTSQQRQTINGDAPSHGGTYILLMTGATFGHVLADVAADCLTRQVALELSLSGGSSQDHALMQKLTTTRYATMLFSFLFMGFALSGTSYGGDFDFSLTYNQLMLTAAVTSVIPSALAWHTTVAAHASAPRRTLREYIDPFVRLLNNHTITFVIACRFASGVLAGISATPANPIAFYWAQVQPLNDNLVSFAAVLVVLAALRLTDNKNWNINYRLLIVGVTVVVLVVDCGATMFTIWDVVRSQYVWIGLPVMEALPSALDYVILTEIISELAEPGPEGENVLREVVTAVSFLAVPFGMMVTKYVDALFAISNEDIMTDASSVRTKSTLTFLIAYAGQLLSLAWLLVLPRSNQDPQRWKEQIVPSRCHGVLLVALLIVCFVWCVAVHVLSALSSTSCLGFAGGRGC